MALLTTPSFTLDTYSRGDVDAPKLALVLPGKLDSKDYASMRGHVDFLAKQGFLAVTFDPPGTWGSPGGLGLYTMTHYIKAANELIAHFGNRPTLILGHSRGSSIATLVATTNEHVVALVSMMCSAVPGKFRTSEDLAWKKRGFYVEMRDLPPGGGPKVKRFELPYAFLEDEHKYDLGAGLRAWRRPKLFIYGKHDPLAPPQAVRTLYELSADPKEIYGLDAHHDYRLSQAWINEVNKVVGRFLEKYGILP